MKVKFNEDIKTLKKGLIISRFLLIICIAGIICYGIKTAKFVEVSAKIVDVSIEYDNMYRDQNRNKYVTYKYQFNNIEHTSKRLVLFATKKSIGNTTDIRVNPNNPIEIQNNSVFIICLSGIFINGMLIYTYKKRK